jgi:hypothetical protein
VKTAVVGRALRKLWKLVSTMVPFTVLASRSRPAAGHPPGFASAGIRATRSKAVRPFPLIVRVWSKLESASRAGGVKLSASRPTKTSVATTKSPAALAAAPPPPPPLLLLLPTPPVSSTQSLCGPAITPEAGTVKAQADDVVPLDKAAT